MHRALTHQIASLLINLQLDGFEPSFLDERNGKIAGVSDTQSILLPTERLGNAPRDDLP